MAGFVCWSCGDSLRGVPRPIRRLRKCPTCRCDLHVCRMCRHWAPGTLGECDHERAERVADKTSANFCTYFRPRPNAHATPGDDKASEARDALNQLFGLDESVGGEPAARADPRAKARAAADDARRALNELFDLPQDAPEDAPEDGRDERHDGEQRS